MAKLKFPKPDKKVLAACYARVISAMVEERVQALSEAAGWWEKSALAFIAKVQLTKEERVAFDRAAKARKLAAGSVIAEEQEQALRTACRLYEKVWAAKNGLPLVDVSYAEYEKRKPEMEAKAQRAQAERQHLLDFLGRVFAPMTFAVAALADNRPQMIAEGKVVLNHSFAATLAHRYSKGDGVRIFLEELVPVLKALSLVNTTGTLQIDAVKALNAALPQVVTQAATELGAAVKPAKVVSMPKGTATAKQPRTAKTTTGEDVGVPGKKVYRAGTVKATVFSLLLDQQEHTLQEVYEVATKAGAKRAEDTLGNIIYDGRQYKAWQVVKGKTTVRVSLT